MFLACVLSPVAPHPWYAAKTKEEQVTVGKFIVPETCIMKNSTGLPCPGCGLTRSWISLCHGRIQESLKHHHLGIPVFIYALLQALRHFLWLAAPSLQPIINRHGRRLDYAMIGILIMLVINWVFVLFKF